MTLRSKLYERLINDSLMLKHYLLSSIATLKQLLCKFNCCDKTVDCDITVVTKDADGIT